MRRGAPVGRPGETGPAGCFTMEVQMHTFAFGRHRRRLVLVRRYCRRRFGRWETVVSHLRRWPRSHSWHR